VSPRKSSETLETLVPTSAGPRRKPRADLYTVLLVIALVAVLIGILFLYLEMGLYEFKFQGGPSPGMVSGQRSACSDQHSAVSVVHRAGQARPLHAFLIPNL
jgi:hypothetical protein